MSSTYVFDIIKKSLKNRRVTYLELASELGMSESGIKKLLTAKDISLQRLNQICNFLEIPLSEVVRSIERRQIREVALTHDQENTLVQEPLLFRIYWRMSVEGQSLAQIKNGEGIENTLLEKSIQKLTKIGLVIVQKDKSVKPLHHGPVRWIGQGPLLQHLNQEWSRLALNRALDHKGQKGHFHHLMSIRLSEEEYSQVLRDLNKFVEDLVHRSEKEALQVSKEKQISRILLMAVNPNGFLGD